MHLPPVSMPILYSVSISFMSPGPSPPPLRGSGNVANISATGIRLEETSAGSSGRPPRKGQLTVCNPAMEDYG